MTAWLPMNPRSSTPLPTVTTSHCTKAGSATSNPMVPTMRAYTGAVASWRRTMRSSVRPSSGAKMNAQMMTDGTMGTPNPELSW